ncbi:MAG: endonuclease [Treponema sp.]|nr:endonuclease [Treponema sp.]
MKGTFLLTGRVLALLLLLPAALLPATLRADAPESPPETVRIMSFNIQIFGAAKMAKPEVVSLLLDLVSQADIIAVQEVRSLSPAPVEQFMALLPERYAYILGPREGRSISKEQYWVIYDAEKFRLLAWETWAGPEDIYERNPLGLYFRSNGDGPGGFDFILINNHLKPGDATREIAALPGVAAWFGELWGERDILIMGDFNADGIYYDESLLADVFPAGRFLCIIPGNQDTTVAPSDNTYDRIIITITAREDYAGSFGVLRFDELYDFSQYSIEPLELSDHYPVWADFYLNADTD